MLQDAGLSITGIRPWDPGIFMEKYLGVWQHLAVSWRRSSGQVEFYRDGNLVSEGTYAKGVTPYATKGTLTIGAEKTNGYVHAQTGGGYDEFRIYSYVLGPVHIKDLFDFGEIRRGRMNRVVE